LVFQRQAGIVAILPSITFRQTPSLWLAGRLDNGHANYALSLVLFIVPYLFNLILEAMMQEALKSLHVWINVYRQRVNNMSFADDVA